MTPPDQRRLLERAHAEHACRPGVVVAGGTAPCQGDDEPVTAVERFAIE